MQYDAAKPVMWKIYTYNCLWFDQTKGSGQNITSNQPIRKPGLCGVRVQYTIAFTSDYALCFLQVI